ncbi:MAG: hypothetical protein ACRC0G_07445 [Fusobacteriaceae bacterium]
MINARLFLENLSPEQAKAFAMDYLAGTALEDQEKIIDLDRLKVAMGRLVTEMEARFTPITQQDSGIIQSGVKEYTSTIKNITPNTEVYLDGKRLIHGSEWTIVNASTGKINISFVTGGPQSIYVINTSFDKVVYNLNKPTVLKSDTDTGSDYVRIICKYDEDYRRLLSLDTPRHSYKMNVEGVYEAYVECMDKYDAHVKGKCKKPKICKNLRKYLDNLK